MNRYRIILAREWTFLETAEIIVEAIDPNGAETLADLMASEISEQNWHRQGVSESQHYSETIEKLTIDSPKNFADPMLDSECL